MTRKRELLLIIMGLQAEQNRIIDELAEARQELNRLNWPPRPTPPPAPKKKSRKQTTAQKKAASARMKRWWADKKAKEGKTGKARKK